MCNSKQDHEVAFQCRQAFEIYQETKTELEKRGFKVGHPLKQKEYDDAVQKYYGRPGLSLRGPNPSDYYDRTKLSIEKNVKVEF